MQQINRTVYRSVFMVLLLGSVPVALALLGTAFIGPAAARGWIIAGAASYLLGVMLVTMIGNVPMNKRLDALSAHTPSGQAYWAEYRIRWTRLNHLRTVSAGITALCYMMAAMT
ncbi:putative membrane protein [Rubricella aquisinus]|uniref:Putative membrane protein n=1 Tax=Rubricella aquisinus TaxID=2028108 RepID=A0A840WJ61_9RHOB|nr:anthrone oxygenase family protein [Rubricella aquisinus]MBB5515129.1 putative membrane protein [Rubricella aquisinus]